MSVISLSLSLSLSVSIGTSFDPYVHLNSLLMGVESGPCFDILPKLRLNGGRYLEQNFVLVDIGKSLLNGRPRISVQILYHVMHTIAISAPNTVNASVGNLSTASSHNL